MKKLVTLAAVLGLSASAAMAGGLEAPIVEGDPIAVEAGAAGSSSALVILPALLLLGALAASSSDS